MSKELIIAISVLLAALPAIVWAFVFFDNPRDNNKSLYFKIFLGGTLTVLPILLMQYLYSKFVGFYPDYDFIYSIKNSIGSGYWIAITYAFVGLSEELVKFYITRFADKNHPELITTINKSLRFGILAALGFAFSENILYFSNIWENLGLKSLLPALLFRSTFTVCAHLCFAGIFAYFYGISKFSEDFINFKKWKGESLAINEYQKFRNLHIFTGLILAITLHGTFNILLEFEQVIPTVILVALMFFYLQYLLGRKSGNLVFVLADRYKSTMAARDEDVVMELIGMWYNEKRYLEVEGICDRLLKRDPDNNVVKIFKAKTAEKLKKVEGK